jgi:uroporphyrinogen decarboxylase
MEQTLIDLALEEPAALRLIDRRLDWNFEVTYRMLDKSKGLIDFIWMGEDLGTQNSQMISTNLYRKIIKPRHKKLLELAKSYNKPVMIHSCGSSSWAFEDFIEIGIKAVDTLQPEAFNMSPAYLKQKYGGRLVFHGCVSIAGALTYGSEDEVVANVKETLEIMMPGGGYCLAPTHWIQDNTPVENVIAMYETAMKYGFYR